MNKRVLTWQGCSNARDLGGLGTRHGRATRWHAVVRSDTPARLAPEGWSALHDYGIRTVVSLRTHGLVEPELDFRSPYPDIATVHAEIEDITDTDFEQQWVETGLWSTPLYYGDALRRWPERHAAAVSAIAQAQRGGVLFHCIRGHDRTGIVALLLLALVGVCPDDVIADYELSFDPDRDRLLAREHSSVREAILTVLAGLDVDDYLRAGGIGEVELAAVRSRLLG